MIIQEEIMSALPKLITLELKAENLGFEWPTIEAIIDQAISECDEIRQSIKLNEGQARLQEEAGDLLHAAISLCVYKRLDIEKILGGITKKFGGRLDALQKIMEDRGYDSLKSYSFDVLLDLWAEAKILADAIPKPVKTEIRLLQEADISQIIDAFAVLDWHKPASLYEGYVTIKWQSSYDFFKKRDIPEIKDLNVLLFFRNQGIGSELMDIAEETVRTRGNCVGIGVGLYDDYGMAQKLYINRGYIPDGQGITYNYQPVKPGNFVCLDDDLVLWLTKNLY